MEVSIGQQYIGLREKVRVGIEALRNGDYVEYTDETLRDLFDEVMHRGRRQSAARDDSRDDSALRPG